MLSASWTTCWEYTHLDMQLVDDPWQSGWTHQMLPRRLYGFAIVRQPVPVFWMKSGSQKTIQSIDTDPNPAYPVLKGRISRDKPHRNPIQTNQRSDLPSNSHTAMEKSIHIDLALAQASGTRSIVQTGQEKTRTNEAPLAANVNPRLTQSIVQAEHAVTSKDE